MLVAAGDFTMGGRRNASDTMAITNFDHNEANTLGNAELTTPDICGGTINWPSRWQLQALAPSPAKS